MKNEAWNIVELPVLSSFCSLFDGLFTEIIHKKTEFRLKHEIKSMKMNKHQRISMVIMESIIYMLYCN